MWYASRISRVLPALAALALIAAGGPAGADVLDVCPTCPYETLDEALAAAEAGDTIVLDGPDDITAAPEVYTLSEDIVINAALDGLEIRGKTSARPDKMVITGTGAGPVITVEEDQSFEIRSVAVTGGTTGLLALANSNVEIRQVLFEGISGVGVDCVEPEEVYMAASIVTGAGDDAVRIDMGGVLNITQCTFLNNTGFGVNAIAGVATVESSLIHASDAGLDAGTSTTLTTLGTWVTDDAGAPITDPGGVVDPDPVTDTLDPAVVFDGGADAFPGEIAAGELRRNTQDQGSVEVEFFARDFASLGRDGTQLAAGADEVAAAAGVGQWIECFVIQRGQPTNWVGERPATIAILTDGIPLLDTGTGAVAQVWIGHTTQLITDPNNRIGPLPMTVPSQIDATFGFVEYTFDLDVMDAAFAGLTDPNTDGYEIYVQPPNVPGPDTGTLDADVLDEDEAAGNQAVTGRLFGFDAIPPSVVTNFDFLADQYLGNPNDGVGFGEPPPPPVLPPGWGAGLLLGDVGANAGYLDGVTGDPQVFFNPPDVPDALDFSIALQFVDNESGFGTYTVGPLPTPTEDPGTKAALLYEDFADTPGFAWWVRSGESQPELINSPASLDVLYNATDTNLDVSWIFADAESIGTQWHAIASIRVMDLAGNETILKPYHLWWFPFARAELRGGPGGNEAANPVFPWGLDRFGGGQDPRDPLPVYPSVQWRVWRLGGAGWEDISGAWSQWMSPDNRSITLDTFFNGTDTLRDLMVAGGGGPGDAYTIAVRGYDEAGNLQPAPGGAWAPDPDTDLVANLIAAGLDYQQWEDPGVSASLGIDTRVQAEFWHNDGNRLLDGGEPRFGAASRIPLPSAESCLRVEGGFNIEMALPDNANPADALIGFELYEDGRFVASGNIDPGHGQPAHTFVLPYDLLNQGEVNLTDFNGSLAFLNAAAPGCPPAQDRLGDDGDDAPESPNRQRNVKYQLLLATGIPAGGSFVYDPTPATVEFTVTVDRELKDDQPVKSFTRE